jgi:hypothetical protein
LLKRRNKRTTNTFLVKISGKAVFVLNIFLVRFVVFLASTGLAAKNYVARNAGGLSSAIRSATMVVVTARLDNVALPFMGNNRL